LSVCGGFCRRGREISPCRERCPAVGAVPRAGAAACATAPGGGLGSGQCAGGEIAQGAGIQSAFAPDSLTTFAHFSVSSANSLAKSAGEPGSGVPPSPAIRALIFGSA